MRILPVIFLILIGCFLIHIKTEASDPTYSVTDLIGKQIQLTRVADSNDSQPTQIDFLDSSNASMGILDSNLLSSTYTLDASTNSFTILGGRFELIFENSNYGSFNEYGANESELFLYSSGTFLITEDVLQNFTDFEHFESFDTPIDQNKWSIYKRTSDSISYLNGKISYIFGPEENDSYWDETALNYSRILPATESWSIELDDINILNSGADVEIYLLDTERTLDTGLYLKRNNTIRIDIFYFDDYSIYVEKTISDTTDINFSVSFNQDSQSIIYKYGKLDNLNEVARFNLASGILDIIDNEFETGYEEGSPIGRNSSAKGFIMGVDVENINKQSYIGDITIGSISISALSSEEIDSDGDGLSDYLESNIIGTDPNLADTDSDGLSDGEEVNTYITDPLDNDSDDDDLDDSAEVSTHLTDPNDADTDEDGLGDGAEVNTYSTNPLLEDTSGDGFSDGFVVTQGADPLFDYSAFRTETVNQVKDARVGSTMIALEDGQAVVRLQMEESSDLQIWEDIGDPANMTVPVPTDSDTKFIRFKMAE